MQFQNLQVDWQQLPRAEAVELKPIERDYLKVLYLSWVIWYVLLLAAMIAAYVFIKPGPALWLTLVAVTAYVLLVSVTFIIIRASFKRKAYAVREKDILYRTGWIFQRTHIIPFNRVQHCVVQSGPIERKFGLSGISIFTAASNIHDISIKGLKPEEAETLKSFIVQQIQPLN